MCVSAARSVEQKILFRRSFVSLAEWSIFFLFAFLLLCFFLFRRQGETAKTLPIDRPIVCFLFQSTALTWAIAAIIQIKSTQQQKHGGLFFFFCCCWCEITIFAVGFLRICVCSRGFVWEFLFFNKKGKKKMETASRSRKRLTRIIGPFIL